MNEEPDKKDGGGEAIIDDTDDSTSTKGLNFGQKVQQFKENRIIKMVWKGVSYTPQRCQWDPDRPTQFSLGLNVLFSFVGLSITSVVSVGKVEKPDDSSQS